MTTGTYVYCLVASARRPSLARVPDGLPGLGRPRVIELDRGRWVVVADAPLDRYGEDAINKRLSDLEWVARAAVAHEAVVESFVRAPAVLPMKLFTIFSNDERALEQMRGDEPRINALVKRVADRHEWGVRVVLGTAARRGRTPPGTATRRRSPQRTPAQSGRDFLQRKRAERDQSAELTRHARETMADLYDRLARNAKEAKRRSASDFPVDTGPLLLDAAFLVPVKQSTRFRGLVEKQARKLEPHGYHVTLTGPWPPYTFVKD